MDKNNILWYKKPAPEWMDGLAIGNGRLAGMLWGPDKAEDIITLNHERLWRGRNRNRENYYVPKGAVSHIRELIEREDYFRATAVANSYLAGKGGKSGERGRIDPYQPAGDIKFKVDDTTELLKRELDIQKGICKITRKAGGGEVVLTSFADVNNGGIIAKWESDQKFGGVLSYSRTEDADAVESVKNTDTHIKFDCSFNGGISYTVLVAYETDGKVSVGEKDIKVENATYLFTATDICVHIDKKETPRDLLGYNFDEGIKKHIQLFEDKMKQFSLDVDLKAVDLPTDERIALLQEGNSDESLIILFYNFGRYLFLSSNICGELPANLQGKWNDDINVEWGSDYHFNINLQMNYWMAEPTNCPEYADKLLALLDSFIPHAKQAAKELYDCRGIWLPHATDVWGRSTPESYGWAAWIGAAPWFAQHYFDHYRYNGDIEFLKNRCYPFLKEVALFYEDYLVKDADGVYQILPSQSPENAVVGTGNFPLTICKSAAMDVQLAYTSLGFAIEAAEILGVDAESVSKWKEMRENLPEFKIGADGRLLEWNKEMEEKFPGHRHVSHLFGVYPADIFTDEEHVNQLEASKKSLEVRLANGGGHTGWSRAHMACIYARFGDGEKLYEHISDMVKEFATESLLDIHPIHINGIRYRVFQIDGNLGAVAALTESVAQARNNKLYLLYALPKHWKKGSLSGLKAPGGHVVDVTWEDGKLKNVKVTIGFGKRLVAVYDKKEFVFEGATGEKVEMNF